LTGADDESSWPAPALDAGVLAHQLGEGVALLDGYSAVLSHAKRMDSEARDAIAMIGVASRRLRRCAEDLARLASAGRGASTGAVSDPRVALSEALAALRSDPEASELDVEAGPLPAVVADAGELVTVFLQLLRAVAAAAWQTGAAAQVWVTGAREGDAARITISDDAPAPPDPARLFEPGAAPRGRGPLVGAGVGATICRRIVEGYGGHIEARQAGPRGIEVQIALPAAAA
jgi:signal transduction histidine kinase